MVVEVSHFKGYQFRMATIVHRDFRHMGNRAHRAWLFRLGGKSPLGLLL